MKVGLWEKADSMSDELLEIVRSVGDRSLEATVYARRAEIAAVRSGAESAIPILDSLAKLLVDYRSPSHYAQYEIAVATALASEGNSKASVYHFGKAVAIHDAVGALEPSPRVSSMALRRPDGAEEPQRPVGRQLQDISSLLMHAGRPELVSTALMSILERAHCLVSARAVSIAADGNEEVLAAFGTITDKAGVRRFTIGTARDRTIELQLEPLADVESQATVNSIAFTIATVQELERGRIEREERLTLWPVDELPAEDDDSVVAGKMREVMLYTRKIAQTSVTVLITGESGTGKEVLARAIHRYSIRVKKPFVPFNCTAVPRELIESHLFGYKRGAFTGADRDNPGLIRAAKDGTLFLDEIGELGLDLQPKLLRFLESGEINPLGETSPFGVNVRIVAATNANLQKLVAEGRFREDLYYRLNVIPIVLPPLRERREEIAPLAQYFALKWSHQLGKGCIRVADDLMEHLVLYHWPGNIRQLSNEINRMVATADPDTPLTLEYLSRPLRDETEQLKRRASGLEMAVPLTDTLQSAVDALEREMIKVALRLNQGKVEAAAKALGISRKGLYLKRQRLGL
jgi:transcriptional regulator with PAS, ATPase and Fis domain